VQKLQRRRTLINLACSYKIIIVLLNQFLTSPTLVVKCIVSKQNPTTDTENDVSWLFIDEMTKTA